jgi:hypothetical protein
MRVIFTTTDSFVSRIIRWMFNEPASHFACTLYDDQVVFQSNFLGVDFASFKKFLMHSRVVQAFDFPMTREEEDAIFDALVENMVGNGYDFWAMTYAGWWGLLYKLFGIEMPKHNRWQSKDQDLCVELAYFLPDRVMPPEIKAMDLSMTTPWKVAVVMKAKYEKEIL